MKKSFKILIGILVFIIFIIIVFKIKKLSSIENALIGIVIEEEKEKTK